MGEEDVNKERKIQQIADMVEDKIYNEALVEGIKEFDKALAVFNNVPETPVERINAAVDVVITVVNLGCLVIAYNKRKEERMERDTLNGR